MVLMSFKLHVGFLDPQIKNVHHIRTVTLFSHTSHLHLAQAKTCVFLSLFIKDKITKHTLCEKLMKKGIDFL